MQDLERDMPTSLTYTERITLHELRATFGLSQDVAHRVFYRIYGNTWRSKKMRPWTAEQLGHEVSRLRRPDILLC